MTESASNSGMMDTYFAPAERLYGDDLNRQIEIISRSPIINELLHLVSGLLAVLNEQRQIIAVNDSMMKALGITNVVDVLGSRPGEALHCVHSGEMPGGCGTSSTCPTCGVVVSIVASLAKGNIEERTCAVTTGEDGKFRDLFFRVRVAPVDIDGGRLLLLFLQDLTYQKRMSQLERVFFHDISNVVSGMLNTSELMAANSDQLDPGMRRYVEIAQKLSVRLVNEIEAQRTLSRSGAFTYVPVYGRVSVAKVFEEIRDTFQNHPVSKGKRLVFPSGITDSFVESDLSLILRVLNNMVTNAFEETPDGGDVRMWIETSDDEITFCVWNNNAIPSSIAKRIFERNFSTKADMGRGNGTFSMKLFGEEILGGKVSFTTSTEEGTIFRFGLPV